jgi:hypothetical protein
VPDNGRVPDMSDLSADELEQAGRDLRAGLALIRPDSAMRPPILAHLRAIDAELALRDGRSRASEVIS